MSDFPNRRGGRTEGGSIGGLNGGQVSGMAGGAAVEMVAVVAVRMDLGRRRGLEDNDGEEKQREERGFMDARNPSPLSGDTYHPMERRRSLA